MLGQLVHFVIMVLQMQFPILPLSLQLLKQMNILLLDTSELDLIDTDFLLELVHSSGPNFFIPLYLAQLVLDHVLFQQ